MFTLFKSKYQHALWPLACLAITVPALLLLPLEGIGAHELFSPSGRIASAIAAYFTSAPSAVNAGSDRIDLTRQLIVGVRALCVALFIVLAALRRRLPDARLLGAQIVLAVVGDCGMIFLLAGQLGMLVSRRRALAWLAALIFLSSLVQTLLIALPLTRSDSKFWVILSWIGTEDVALVICMAVIYMGMHERRARLALALTHAELQATQALLGEAVAASERLRIARDLHDVAGHHLTALKLHLDLAQRQAGAQAPAALGTAAELASSLLAEVRVLVSSERAAKAIDLRGALTTLCASVPSPHITLKIDEQLEINSPAVAHGLFCAVQEAISNAMRHAQAHSMTITLGRDPHGAVLLHIEDDGVGSSAPEGNGLRGMRERLALLGGTLRAVNSTTRGFALAIHLPVNEVQP